MKTRDQIYAQEATSLLRDVTMYQVLKKKQILSMYPGKEKKVENLLSYLVKQGRIYRSGEYYLAQPDGDKNIDHGLMAAVWVLIDFIDRVEYHSSGDYPAKVIFFADGEIYEVIRYNPKCMIYRCFLIAHSTNSDSGFSSGTDRIISNTCGSAVGGIKVIPQ